MKKPIDLLEGNRNWVDRINKEDPEFFKKLTNEQKPEILWIGCSDSRVPATEITDKLPGSIFVHRNIANLVIHTDINALSVITFAVMELKVKHIIVCGHYNCGGVRAAMGNYNSTILNKWLRNIKDTYVKHKDELEAIEDRQKREDRMVELNVMEQVFNLKKISFIQQAWKSGEFPYIHGWVYGVSNGIIKDLDVTVNNVDKLDPLYHF